MDTISAKVLCANCAHLIVNGVACDWQPDACPFLAKNRIKENKSSTSTGNYSLLVLEASGEYDAIRSNN